MRAATSRSWKHLAKERIVDARPTIPLRKRFWPLSEDECHALEELFATERLRRLATLLRSREDDTPSVAPFRGKNGGGTAAGSIVLYTRALPQDLKLEIDQLTRADAMKAARFLAAVVGKAHARQMDLPTPEVAR